MSLVFLPVFSYEELKIHSGFIYGNKKMGDLPELRPGGATATLGLWTAGK
jgi:hypothetical protein